MLYYGLFTVEQKRKNAALSVEQLECQLLNVIQLSEQNRLSEHIDRKCYTELFRMYILHTVTFFFSCSKMQSLTVHPKRIPFNLKCIHNLKRNLRHFQHVALKH